MADYNVSIAPFKNVEFQITTIFGQYPSGSIHRGLDISTGTNTPVYSVVDGTVLDVDVTATSGGYGNMVIVVDDNNVGHLFAHFRDKALVNIGDRVSKGQLLGYEGTTGQSSGIHLHWEMQKIIGGVWQYQQPISRYLNPSEFMNIPNQYGITGIYIPGEPPSPIPTFRKRKGFNFVLFGYNRKMRKVI